MADTIFQSAIFTDYLLPFLLVFVIVFGILEKTKLIGDGKKQLNAIIAFVIGLIFVGALYPKEILGNLILFLTVSLIVIFVFLLLYGFVRGDKDGLQIGDTLKKVLGGIVGIAVIIAVIWATGYDLGGLLNKDWSNTFFTNLLFIVVIAVAMALILRNQK